MNGTFIDNLNLRPQEKRLIVGMSVVAFVVLNILFVVPHFKDYRSIKKQLKAARDGIADRSKKIEMDRNPSSGYLWQLDQLNQQSGGAVAVKFSGEIQLQTTVAQKAREAGVNVQAYDPVNLVRLGTNAESQFFESESIRITVDAPEDNLVNFLYIIGNDPAMIRVRELSFQPTDANRYRLHGQITLTAEYKKSDKAPATKTPPAKSTVTLPTPAPPPATMPIQRPPNPNAAPPRSGPPPFPAMPGRLQPGQKNPGMRTNQ